MGPGFGPYPTKERGSGYSNDEGSLTLASLFGGSALLRILDYISAPTSVNQTWPEDVDKLAGGKALGWSGPYQVDGCGSSASGASVYCVAAQRIPSADPDADAVTFGHYVFYDVDGDTAIKNADGTYSIEPGILAHEMVHVRQWEQNGDAFVERYLANSGHYENEAYEVGP